MKHSLFTSRKYDIIPTNLVYAWKNNYLPYVQNIYVDSNFYQKAKREKPPVSCGIVNWIVVWTIWPLRVWSYVNQVRQDFGRSVHASMDEGCATKSIYVKGKKISICRQMMFVSQCHESIVTNEQRFIKT